MGRFVIFASMLLFLLAPAGASPQEIDLAKIRPLIVGAAEQLRRAAIGSELTLKEYHDIMEISCNTFAVISQDRNFENLLKVYEIRQYDEHLANEIREIFLNFRSFLEFVLVERDLLLDAGLSEAAVGDILAQLMKARLEAAGFKLDAETLLTDFRRLADQACSARQNVSESVEHDEMVCNIARFGVFAIGAVVVVVDGAALFVTKIPPAVVTASGLAGSAVMAGAAMMSQC